jgi:uncharacterized RDD family membrane protein YckC
MEYEDRLTIATPEGLDLSLSLAGAASRFVAAVVDLTIQTILLILLAVLAGQSGGGLVVVAIVAVLGFLVIFGYDVLFEVLNSGRTPGKQLNGLRVVRVGGHPVGFLTSAIRNVIRPIDFLPGAYLLGATAILATKKNQRLGDIVAGTIVVRQRPAKLSPLPGAAPAPLPLRDDDPLRTWDTSRISVEELATVKQFLERRGSIDYGARVRLAGTLGARLRPKVTGVPSELGDEPFLEALASIRRRLGG